MRSAVAGRRTSLDPFAPFKHVQQPGKPRTLDVQGLADCRLRAAGIVFDDEHDRVLRWAQPRARKRANEVLEHSDLQPAQEITDMSVELPERQLFRRRRRRCLADAARLASRQAIVCRFSPLHGYSLNAFSSDVDCASTQ